MVVAVSRRHKDGHADARPSCLRRLLPLSVFLSLFLLPSPIAYAVDGGGGPGGIDELQFSLTEEPGSAYPWEGQSGTGTNTGNGNKMTTLPIVGWTARGGLPVSLSLFHNSQGEGTSEMGAKWSHSYDIYLVTDPVTGTASIHWGDGLAYPFAFDGVSGDYFAPTGIHDSLVAAWDTNNNPTSFALTTKSGVTYLFSGGTGNRWNCVSISDRNSNTITIAHNSGDFVTAVTDPSGRALTFTYGTGNKLTEITDPLGRSFLLSYNTGGDLYQVIYPSAIPASGLNPTATLAYNANHCVTTLTDARSQNWTFTYSSNNAVLTETNPLSQTTSYGYTSGYTTITDPRSYAIRHNYSGGKLSSVVDQQNYTTSYSYDSNFNKTQVTDAASKVWTFTYDGAGNQLTATDPLSHTTTTTYNALNQPLTITTAGSRVTTYTYDTNGNPTSVTNPNSETTTLAYSGTYGSYGLPTSATDALSHTTTFQYDLDGNKVSTTDPTSRVSTATFDALGRPLTATAGSGTSALTTTTVYDSTGNVASVTAPGGRTTSFTYDLGGNKLTQTNALSQTNTFVYDAAGKLTSHTDALSRVVYYGYDASGNKTSFTDGNGNTTYYVYDGRSHLTSLSYPDYNGESYSYDARGNLASTTDGRSVTQYLSYDDAGRATAISYDDGVTASVSFGYDVENRKTSMVDGTGTTSYSYDNAGRMTGRTSPQGSVAYAYNAAGQKTSRTVSGQTTSYTYDSAGRLSTAVTGAGTTTYSCDTLGRLSTTAFPNSTGETRSYDSATGDLLQIETKNTTTNAVISRQTYTFDSLGRKATETLADSSVRSFTYDNAGQLTDEIRTGGLGYTVGYSYDNAGNRLTKTLGSTTEYYSYDSANKLQSAGAKTYTYDGAGNTTSVTTGSNTTTLNWDGASRLTGITYPSSATNSFTYNGLGQRVGKSDSTGTFSYKLADDAIDANVLADGAATYQYGMGLISEVRGGNTRVYHADSLGTTRTLSDASGNTSASLETDAFGMTVFGSGTGTPFGFGGGNGYQSDTDSGLMRLGHRYYDNSTGRFISRDPIQAGKNWYAYCENDPINAIDPEGLDAKSDADAHFKGKVYPSTYEAVKAFADYAWDKSKKDKEWGASIVPHDTGNKDGNGKPINDFTVGPIDIGTESVIPNPTFAPGAAGYIHTHPYDKGDPMPDRPPGAMWGNPGRFSGYDVDSAKKAKVPKLWLVYNRGLSELDVLENTPGGSANGHFLPEEKDMDKGKRWHP
ncbi:MAG: RHS repeat-associated core domain-containing protein [Armatimonadota bacterium]